MSDGQNAHESIKRVFNVSAIFNEIDAMGFGLNAVDFFGRVS
jgi:hypothetical protein